MEEVGALILELFKSAAKAKDSRTSGEPSSAMLRRILLGEQAAPPPVDPPAPPDTKPATRPAPAPVPAPPGAPVHVAPSPLLADFHQPQRFLAAFVLAEALGPPVAFKGHGPG